MKSKFALCWFVVSLALGAMLIRQARQTRTQQQKLEALQLQVERFSEETRGAENKVQQLQKVREETRRELAAAQDQAARVQAPLPPANSPKSGLPASGAVSGSDQTGEKAAGGGMGDFLTKMTKDPEMRKAMAQQQRMGLNMIYSSLFKQLQIPPDQEQKLKDMLLEQQMANMSQAGALLDTGGNRAEAMQKLGDDQKQRQDQIKQLIGDEKYAQFQDYNQTVGERMMLDQMGGDVALSPEQKDQLLGIVLEEKKNSQINNSGDPTTSSKDFQNVIGSPEAMDKLLAQQKQVNERVLERSGTILTPDQIRKLEPILNSQLEMQAAGAKMARQMFSQPGGPAQVPSTVSP